MEDSELEKKTLSVDRAIRLLDVVDLGIDAFQDILDNTQEDPKSAGFNEYAASLRSISSISRSVFSKDKNIFEIPQVKSFIITYFGEKMYDNIRDRYQNNG